MARIIAFFFLALALCARASLTTNFGGGEVPLEMRSHQVSAVVEGGAAITTVEQVFVNPGDWPVEGIYRYPLPENAVLTAFSMSIGGEMIEADVVETKRGRRIFRSYLQTTQDPALTEREAGNVFRTRIFPIQPGEEKTIRLVYTEPAGGVYVYPVPRQAILDGGCENLRFELKTGDFSQILETAQLQNSDEVRVDLKREAGPRLTRFQAGGEQFWLVQPALQTTPPKASSPLRRVLILADTSGSMNPDKRRKQARFIGDLLKSAGDSCVFSLAACDASARWVWDANRPANAVNIAAALEFLSRAVSLGWSDLETAFNSAKTRDPEAEVIYVGDGIGIGFERTELGNLTPNPRIHAVLTGPGVDAEAMRQLGGVSLEIAGEDTLARFLRLRAGEKLAPAKIEFHGVENLTLHRAGNPGFARFASATPDAAVTVDGRRFALNADYPESSAVPRLWLAAHVRERAQGELTEELSREIVGLSERWHVMTPLTSFLVMESDEEREKFGIRRRKAAVTQWNLRAVRWLDAMRLRVESRLTSLEDEAPMSVAVGGVWHYGGRYPASYFLADPEASAANFSQQPDAELSALDSVLDNNDPMALEDGGDAFGAIDDADDPFEPLDIKPQTHAGEARTRAVREIADKTWRSLDFARSQARPQVNSFVSRHFGRLAGFGQFLRPRVYGQEDFGLRRHLLGLRIFTIYRIFCSWAS